MVNSFLGSNTLKTTSFLVTASALFGVAAVVAPSVGLPAMAGYVAGGAGVVCALLAAMLAGRAASYVDEITGVCERLAQGDYDARLVIPLEKSGQIAQLRHAVNNMADQADAFVREAQVCMDYVSRNRYYRPISARGLKGTYVSAAERINKVVSTAETRNGGFVHLGNTILQTLRGMVSNMGKTMGDVTHATDKTASAVEDTARKAAEAAESTHRFSGYVQMIASATEEMSAAVAEITTQLTKTQQETHKANEEAGHARGVVTSLSEGAQKIGHAATLIADIAEQTNLLALNATIEAARAGAAGMGFSVVAKEVKDLALESGNATQTIEQLIKQIQAGVEGTTGAVHSLEQTITYVAQSSTVVASAVEEQAVASREIAQNATNASNETGMVTESVQSIDALMRDVKHQMDGLRSVLQQMSQSSLQAIEGLQGDMNGFMTQLQTRG